MKTYKMTINGKHYEARILEYSNHEVKVRVNGEEFVIELEKEDDQTPKLVRTERLAPVVITTSAPKQEAAKPGSVVAPIPGTIHAIKVKEGDIVKSADVVLVLEAMKMESDIATPYSGKVKSIHVKPGDSVHEGQVLIEIGE